HCPEQRTQDEEYANHAEDNCRVGEKQDLDQDKDNADHEKSDGFPARQASQIMAEEEKGETKGGDNPGQTRAWNLEFEISADDAEEKEQGCELRDPEREPFKSGGIKWDQSAL